MTKDNRDNVDEVEDALKTWDLLFKRSHEAHESTVESISSHGAEWICGNWQVTGTMLHAFKNRLV